MATARWCLGITICVLLIIAISCVTSALMVSYVMFGCAFVLMVLWLATFCFEDDCCYVARPAQQQEVVQQPSWQEQLQQPPTYSQIMLGVY